MRLRYVKFRYWVILLGIIAGLGVYGSTRILRQDKYTKVDMVDINERYTEISRQLDSGLELQDTNSCHVLLRKDADYQEVLYNAVKNQDIIMDYEKDGQLVAKIIFEGQQSQLSQLYKEIAGRVVITLLIMVLAVLVVMLIIYREYIVPFKKMQRFAGNISKGNFDIPLPIKKNNYFGAFTESFDIMREELKRARQSEFEANRSKKELVASLSHDIKTPVATIEAICEILMLKLKDEAALKKIGIINNKAGVIDRLISDMFHSTLEDLDKLKITPKEEFSTIIRPMLDDINHFGKIHYKNPVPECLIIVDKMRLNQVIDNVINNSYKYADTDIDVSFEKCDKEMIIKIQDYGQGMDEDELPLVHEKFFRGKNAEGESGSGLGLYLSKIFMEGMGGKILEKNDNGFYVELRILVA